MHDLENDRIFGGCVDNAPSGDVQLTNGVGSELVNGLATDTTSVSSHQSKHSNGRELELVLKK